MLLCTLKVTICQVCGHENRFVVMKIVCSALLYRTSCGNRVEHAIRQEQDRKFRERLALVKSAIGTSELKKDFRRHKEVSKRLSKKNRASTVNGTSGSGTSPVRLRSSKHPRDSAASDAPTDSQTPRALPSPFEFKSPRIATRARSPRTPLFCSLQSGSSHISAGGEQNKSLTAVQVEKGREFLWDGLTAIRAVKTKLGLILSEEEEGDSEGTARKIEDLLGKGFQPATPRESPGKSKTYSVNSEIEFHKLKTCIG